jgi:hypothetical protein
MLDREELLTSRIGQIDEWGGFAIISGIFAPPSRRTLNDVVTAVMGSDGPNSGICNARMSLPLLYYYSAFPRWVSSLMSSISKSNAAREIHPNEESYRQDIADAARSPDPS